MDWCNGCNASRAKIPIPQFKNSECVKEFFKKFEHRMQILRVPYDERVAHLENSVSKSKAEDWFARYVFFHGRYCNWYVLKDAFIKHFTSDFDYESAFYEMEARVMSIDESVRDYVDSKLALMIRCDPDMSVKDQIKYVEKGLLDKYKELLFTQSFKDFESLTDHLILLEGKINRYLRDKSRALPTAVAEEQTAELSNDRLASVLESMESRLDRIVSAVRRGVSTDKNNYRRSRRPRSCEGSRDRRDSPRDRRKRSRDRCRSSEDDRCRRRKSSRSSKSAKRSENSESSKVSKMDQTRSESPKNLQV